MYPGLLLPLLVLVAAALLGLGLIVWRQPVSRRLAFRQVARRPTEAALVICGSVLGTAIIVGALVVGDTLGFSVRQVAYRTLGPVDERVVVPSPSLGPEVAARLGSLRTNPKIDGVLAAQVDQAAAYVGARTSAEPRVLAWQLDVPSAATFGAAGGPSGLSGPAPRPGTVVVNQPLASSLHLQVGEPVTLLLYQQAVRFTVARIVPDQGLAGTGLGATVNRNAFLPAGALSAAARAAGAQPHTVVFVSNVGGVQTGDRETTAATRAIRSALGPLGTSVLVQTPKHDVLKQARETGDALGALFLMIGSFSIIAGALLLVNIFVMLAEERKSTLGMLRAVGLKRSRLIGSFTLEGATYAFASVLPGILLGVLVGWAVSQVAAQIFRSWSADGNGLQIAFSVTPVTIVNGAALGLVIALATIVATSARISRFNVIAAIRDLPTAMPARARRRLLIWSTSCGILLALLSIPAVAASAPEATFLLPSLAALCFVPALRRFVPSRAAYSIVAALVLTWTLLVSVVRPGVFDGASMAVFVILGTLVAFSSVVLVSENQDVVLAPVRRMFPPSTERGLAVRLAVAYPLAKKFRTGATLVMYALITLVLVLLTQITAVIDRSVATNVVQATGGYALRLDMNPLQAPTTIASLTTGPFSRDVDSVAPVTSATAQATDPGHRTKDRVSAVAEGVPDRAMTGVRFEKRLSGATSDAAVWALLAQDDRYVVLDAFFNSGGGPNGAFYAPGDQFTLFDPQTGRSYHKTIAGILSNGLIFYPTGGSATAFPVVMSTRAVRAEFPSAAQLSGAFVKVAPGVSADALVPRLQAHYLADSLVATALPTAVRQMFSANTAFFRLMQGFLALGLVVGVTGLGVVMVRAVRERRRTIGVLRALGFRSGTVEKSFLAESTIVAAEGIALGVVFGVVTTWLMYLQSAAFNGVRAGYPIAWSSIALLAGATLLASVLATYGPARRASRIRPALAVRIVD